MAVHLVRHAKAGHRPDWSQPDELRPLTEAGHKQALALVDALKGEGIDRILSSRYVRCTQSVVPLAETLGIVVEEHPGLAEEAGIGESWALLESVRETEAVLCTHGNILGDLLDRAFRQGTDLIGDDQGMKKGSWWTLTTDGGRFTVARYNPPPV